MVTTFTSKECWRFKGILEKALVTPPSSLPCVHGLNIVPVSQDCLEQEVPIATVWLIACHVPSTLSVNCGFENKLGGGRCGGACRLSTWEVESQGDQEFKASLCYIVSSRQKLHDILSLKTYK